MYELAVTADTGTRETVRFTLLLRLFRLLRIMRI
jgi:hypothetical protein